MSYDDLAKGLAKARRQHRPKSKFAIVDQDVVRSKPLACFSKLLEDGQTLILYLALQEDTFIVRETIYSKNNLSKTVKPEFKFLTLAEARQHYLRLIKREVQ